MSTAAVEGIEFRVVRAVHEATSDDRRRTCTGGVVLQSLVIGSIDAESTVDVSPSPTVCCDVGTRSDVPCGR